MILLLVLILLFALCILVYMRSEQITKFGLIILGLFALFTGGCSLFIYGVAIFDWDGWNGYGGAIFVFTSPFFVLAALLGWLVWRSLRQLRQADKAAGEDPDP